MSSAPTTAAVSSMAVPGWSDDEVNWVNQNLTGFRGRVTRDNWVEQAKVLASGGETEFSKRVDKGDVY